MKVPISYSNLVITKLKLDGFRHALIKKKVANKKRARKYLGLDVRAEKRIAKKDAMEPQAAPDLD